MKKILGLAAAALLVSILTVSASAAEGHIGRARADSLPEGYVGRVKVSAMPEVHAAYIQSNVLSVARATGEVISLRI